MAKPRAKLRRYTDLPSLIYLLSCKKITLLDPRGWDDTNDSYFIALYRERNNLESVLALCFTQASERYHHWRVFASGPSGVCITFDRKRLLATLNSKKGLRCKEVEYLTREEVRRVKKINPEKLPFVKRYPYQDEREFRIVHAATDDIPTYDVSIPLSTIDRITLSPWLNESLYAYVKRIVSDIKDCAGIPVLHSRLISNEEWKQLGERSARGAFVVKGARRPSGGPGLGSKVG